MPVINAMPALAIQRSCGVGVIRVFSSALSMWLSTVRLPSHQYGLRLAVCRPNVPLGILLMSHMPVAVSAASARSESDHRLPGHPPFAYGARLGVGTHVLSKICYCLRHVMFVAEQDASCVICKKWCAFYRGGNNI